MNRFHLSYDYHMCRLLESGVYSSSLLCIQKHQSIIPLTDFTKIVWMLRINVPPLVVLCHLDNCVSLVIIQDHNYWLALVLLVNLYL